MSEVPLQQDYRDTFELDCLLPFVLEIGHVTPGYLGTRYPVAFSAAVLWQ